MQTGFPLISAIRTVVWGIFFYVGSLLLVGLAAILAPFSQGALVTLTQWWSGWHRICAAIFLGQRVQVTGVLPTGAAFVIMKHEAMFETIDMPLLFHRPVVFAKAELFDIPLWGRLARRYGLLPIERDAGAKALRQMRRSALDVMAKGRPLILLPEGTRVPHGEHPSIRSGFAGLYALLGVDVIPIAVNSGALRHARWRWVRLPGTISYQVGATIRAGLPRDEAENLAHRAINLLNAQSR